MPEKILNKNEQEFARIIECMEAALTDAKAALHAPTPLERGVVLSLGIRILACDVSMLKLRQAMEV